MSERNIETYRIRLKTSGGELEIEGGDQEFVEEQFDSLAEKYLEKMPSQSVETEGNQATLSDVGTRQKKSSLAEIYQHASIPYKRDAALLVGWYLELLQGQDNFTKSEIEDAAIDAKIELGKNLSRDLSHLVENGHLLEVDQRDNETAYYLTRTGEDHVAEEFGLPERYIP